MEVLGIGHLGVGAILHRREIASAVRRGVVGTVDDHGPAAAAWWFLVAAPTMWSIGRLMRALERGQAPTAPLRSVGAVVGLTGAVGAVVMPRSPFVLVAATGVSSAVGASRRHATR